MRVSGGHTAEVWRSTRDRFGDKATDALVGTIEHVLIDWRGFTPSDGFQETATLAPVMFVPKTDIRVQARDRIMLDGKTFAVLGVMWDEPHPVTGYDFGYYALDVEAAV